MKRSAAEEVDLLRGLYAPPASPASPAETAAPEVFEYPHCGRNFPRAEVRLGQHTDGRWMWATSYLTANGGSSYALLPKWGNFAATHEEALQEAVDELRDRLTKHARLCERWHHATDVPQAHALLGWLGAPQPAQADLFGAVA